MSDNEIETNIKIANQCLNFDNHQSWKAYQWLINHDKLNKLANIDSAKKKAKSYDFFNTASIICTIMFVSGLLLTILSLSGYGLIGELSLLVLIIIFKIIAFKKEPNDTIFNQFKPQMQQIKKDEYVKWFIKEQLKYKTLKKQKRKLKKQKRKLKKQAENSVELNYKIGQLSHKMKNQLWRLNSDKKIIEQIWSAKLNLDEYIIINELKKK